MKKLFKSLPVQIATGIILGIVILGVAYFIFTKISASVEEAREARIRKEKSELMIEYMNLEQECNDWTDSVRTARFASYKLKADSIDIELIKGRISKEEHWRLRSELGSYLDVADDPYIISRQTKMLAIKTTIDKL